MQKTKQKILTNVRSGTSFLTMAALTTHSHCGIFPRHSILGKGVGKIMEGLTCYISIWSDMLSVIRECTDFDQVTRKAVR